MDAGERMQHTVVSHFFGYNKISSTRSYNMSILNKIIKHGYVEMKQIILATLLTLLPLYSAWSEDANSPDDPRTIIGSETYDQKMCIERYASKCIDAVCRTSEERNCSDKCQESAHDKCPDSPLQ